MRATPSFSSTSTVSTDFIPAPASCTCEGKASPACSNAQHHGGCRVQQTQPEVSLQQVHGFDGKRRKRRKATQSAYADQKPDVFVAGIELGGQRAHGEAPYHVDEQRPPWESDAQRARGEDTYPVARHRSHSPAKGHQQHLDHRVLSRT